MLLRKSNEKKILFILPDLRFGGVEISLINLLNNLENNVQCTVLMYDKDYSQLPKIKNNSVDIKIIKKSKITEFLINSIGKTTGKYDGLVNAGYLRKYAAMRYIKRHSREYDFIINYHSTTFKKIMKNAKVNRKKMIMWYHGPDYVERVFDDENIDLYENIVVVSDAVKKELTAKKEKLKDKIRVINNIFAYKDVKEKCNDEILLTKDNFNIVSVGRISEEKGCDTAVEALKILDGRIPDLKWYWVGGAKEYWYEFKNKINDMIRKNNLENVFIMTGEKDNPYPYMQQSDIYVQPSHFESFGISIAEAQMCGTAVVSTNTHGARTLINNGTDGIITKDDPYAIAEAIYDLYSNAEKRRLIAYNAGKINFEEKNRKILRDFYDLIEAGDDVGENGVYL